MEHVSEVLGAVVGDLDRNMIGMGGERDVQARSLASGETFSASAEDMTDAVERVALAASVAEGLLLDPAADVIDRSAG